MMDEQNKCPRFDDQSLFRKIQKNMLNIELDLSEDQVAVVSFDVGKNRAACRSKNGKITQKKCPLFCQAGEKRNEIYRG